jgi:hypothetical protein
LKPIINATATPLASIFGSGFLVIVLGFITIFAVPAS